MSGLPSNGWGDTAFHIANACRALEEAAREALSPRERAVADRVRRALMPVRDRAVRMARERAEMQEVMTP